MLTIHEKLSLIKEEAKRTKDIYLFRMGYVDGKTHTLEETAHACGMKDLKCIQKICCQIYWKLRELEKNENEEKLEKCLKNCG